MTELNPGAKEQWVLSKEQWDLHYVGSSIRDRIQGSSLGPELNKNITLLHSILPQSKESDTKKNAKNNECCNMQS